MSLAIRSSVRCTLRPWSTAALAALVWTGSASAADTAAPGIEAAAPADDGLAEIVVTAQFRAQKLQDTPIAITAVNAATMEQRGQTSLHDLSQQAPNVTLVETGGAFGPGMTSSIRGIGQSDFDPAMSPGVGIYIDDVYYTSLTGSNFALLDLDRVEILRGPQGTLAGANSEGGAIKLYSVKPQGNDSGSVKASYGERNLVDVQGMGDISLIKDMLFMRVSGVSHTQDGYVTRVDYGCAYPSSGIPANGGTGGDCVAGHEGGKSYNGARLALRWLAGDNFEANFAGDVTVDNSEVAAVTLLKTNPSASGAAYGVSNSGLPSTIQYDNRFISSNPYVSYANFCAKGIAGNTYCWAPYSHTKEYGFNLTMDWKLADALTLKSISGYREFDSAWTNDDDASPLGSSLGYSDLLNHTLTQELRLSGAVQSFLDYTVGGYFLNQTTTYVTHQVLDYVFAGSFDFLGDDPVHERDYAGFLNGSWHLTDRLNLNTGFRYTHQLKTYTYNRYNPSTIGGGDSVFFAAGFSGTEGKYEGSKADYRVNLDYRWTEELMTYASISTGFKGGGTNPRPYIASQIESFKPETLTAYELGAKSDWFNRALRVNVAVFYNKYRDIQVTLLSCPQFSDGSTTQACAAPVNGGDAEIYGAELETSYHWQGLTVDGTYSHQQFQYTYINAASGIPLGATGQGFQPSKWSLGAQYELLVPNGATLTPRLDYVYSAGYFTNANNDANSYQNGYHELNGRLTYRPESSGWEAALAATNLLNRLWYTQTFDLSSSQGQVYGIPAAPRTVWVEFKKKF